MARLRPGGGRSDYELVILDELDLGTGGGQRLQLRRNFADGKLVYVPQVYWDYTSRKCSPWSVFHGIPVTDMDDLRAQAVRPQVAGERGVEIFLHPGLQGQLFSTPTCTRQYFRRCHRPRRPHLHCRGLRHHWRPVRIAINTTWPATCWASSAGIITKWPSFTWSAAGYLRQPGSRISSLPCARSANPFSNGPSAKFPSANCSSICSRPPPFRHGSAALAGTSAKDPAQYRGPGPPTLPRLNLWDTAQPFLEEWVPSATPPVMLKRLQRHAPSWLEQLPQLPDVVHGQPAAGREARAALSSSSKRPRTAGSGTRTGADARRHLVAALACGAAAISCFPRRLATTGDRHP